MKYAHFLILILLFLIVVPCSAADLSQNGISITRQAPDHGWVGEKYWITLVVENTEKVDKTVEIRENIDDTAGFSTDGVSYTTTTYGAKFPYYAWTIKLHPGESTFVTYWIVPRHEGNYIISPTPVTIDGKKGFLTSHAIDFRIHDTRSQPAATQKADIPLWLCGFAIFLMAVWKRGGRKE